jgi:transcriptional regulator with XRE-family HTH domain
LFSSYNLEPFGIELKRLRELNGLTQTDVQALCGINPDTLRRIENGYTIPKYETLEILSELYKVDLLDLLRTYRSNEKLYNYYDRLDSLICNYDIKILQDLSVDFDAFLEDGKADLITPYTYEQFKLMIEGIGKYNNAKEEIKLESLNTFIKALKLSIHDFELENYSQFNYNIIEKRILILIALGLAVHKNFELSNNYLSMVITNMDLKSRVEYNVSLLIIKVYFQLSYNSHSLNENKKALEYSNRGIEYSIQNNLMFGLYLLYYRKAVAEYLLDDENHVDSFSKSIAILEIQTKLELATIYKDITREMYGIII